MVLTPNESTFQDMLGKIANTHSYTGGDQGFLNEYFPGLLTSPVFDAEQQPPGESAASVCAASAATGLLFPGCCILLWQAASGSRGANSPLPPLPSCPALQRAQR